MLQAPDAAYVFPARQTLTFSVDWRVFTAGTAVFHLEQQGDEEKVTATADTAGNVNMLFPVMDKFSGGLRYEDRLLDRVQQADAGGPAQGERAT